MREVLFRGKPNNAIMEDDFIYGLLVKQVDLDGKDALCIQTWERDDEGVSSRVLEVIPSTIGEFTGLTDKNGTKIFEGDIIRHYNNADFPEDYTIGAVYYDKNRSMFLRTSKLNGLGYAQISNKNAYEVIGNIYDNPELLKEGENK